MAIDRSNDPRAFRDFLDEKLSKGGTSLTLEEALVHWETETQAEEVRESSPAVEDLVDLDFEAFCAREGDDAITLEEVREATATIPGSMAEAIIDDERAERF